MSGSVSFLMLILIIIFAFIPIEIAPEFNNVPSGAIIMTTIKFNVKSRSLVQIVVFI